MEQPTVPPMEPAAETTPWRAWRADLRRYTSKMKGAGPLRAFYYLSTEETLWAIGAYRLNQALGRVRVPILGTVLRTIGRMVYLHVRRQYGIDLPATARIGPGLYIGHAGGIVIHSEAVIGANCAMTHGVTVGVGGSGDRRGVPRIGSHVFISSGAKIYGRIAIGDYVVIRPNATVSRPVPPFSAVGGVPGVVTGSVARDDVLRLLFGPDFAKENADRARSE